MPFRYRNAPLIEAIFEFAPRVATLADDGKQRILAAFPDYTGEKQILKGMGAHVKMTNGEVTAVPVPDRTRQWNESKTRMVQFAEDLCAFNALRPYTTYTDYVSDMERLVSAYARESGATHTLFLGQRYLNRIEIPDEDPSTYFSLIPAGWMGGRNRPFAIQVEFEKLRGGGNVMMNLAYQGSVDGKHRYLLDLYAHFGGTLPFTWADVSGWQEAAHEAIERAFEEPLTSKCRQMLEREET